MYLTRDQLIVILGPYLDKRFITPAAMADILLIEEAKEKQKHDDITDRLMWGTD